jgi:DNA-binding transcriptional ArsR family regulator
MDTRELERLFKACANARRMRILAFLKRSRFATVGEIADHIKLSFKATSKHLGVLKGARLVEVEQTGLSMNYRIARSLSSHARTLLSLL